MQNSKLGAIFDMDGVLVDSSAAHSVAWKRLGEKIRQPFSQELFDRTFGMHNRQIIPMWLGSRLTAEEVERYSDEKEAMYREAAAAAVRPIDGAVELVRSLREAGFALAVGSSGPLANVQMILDLLGIAGCFQALSTGDEVRHGKPHPEVFLKAIGKLGLPARSCLVIEDAPQGIDAGIAAGAFVAAVTTSRPAHDLRAAHLVVESLREIDAERVRAILAGPAR